jgi:putative transposase
MIGSFPNEGSILRLLVPLAIETNAKWMSRSYISFNEKVLQSDSTA